MKKFVHAFFLFLLSTSVNAQQTKKALFIISDSIPADVMEHVPHPNLAAIAKVGGYTRAYVGGEKGGYSQTPTISAVSYNSLLKKQFPQKTIAVFSTWTDNRTKLIGKGLPITISPQIKSTSNCFFK